jgi:broad specificity phosphatase PhoE
LETTDILLVRHGQTESNLTGFHMGWSEEDINETGLKQARKLANRLAEYPLASIYTSPMRRARTTAAIIAGPHKLQQVVLKDLCEIELGDWNGLYARDIRQKWPELWEQWQMDPTYVTVPNGESIKHVTERAVRAFNLVAESNEGKVAVMVSHDVVIRILVAYVLGVTNKIYRRIDVANCSLTRVRIKNRTQLVVLNDTSHIEESYL